MPEQLTLTDPEVTPPKVTTDYRVVFVQKDVEAKRFIVRVRGTNGEVKEFREDDDAAITVIKALNKSNNSVKSEQKRILEKLVADGKLNGTVEGTPD